MTEASPLCAAGDTAIVLDDHVRPRRRRMPFNAHCGMIPSFHLAPTRRVSCSLVDLVAEKGVGVHSDFPLASRAGDLGFSTAMSSRPVSSASPALHRQSVIPKNRDCEEYHKWYSTTFTLRPQRLSLYVEVDCKQNSRYSLLKEWDPQLRNCKLLMRRRVPGGWEYREMTSEEMEDLIAWHVMK
ncbi:hypothetical protein [Rhizobium etli]|uniref:hypothetical protein n=1 Tax=Rhizobium etli TaxID=29449 RepID=UPI0018DF81D4|nr:hypothetical protein [Rhizobium etli]